MAAVEAEVPARYYLKMAEVLTRRGVDVAALLTAAQVDPRALQRPDPTLTLAQVEALITHAEAMVGRVDLSFDLGKALKLSTHTIVGFALLSSPNIDYALKLAARYFRLILPTFRMRVQSAPGRTEIAFEPMLSMTQTCLHFHLETIAAAVHWEMRELMSGHLPPYVLSLSFAPPPHVARYRELAEAQCRFSAEATPGIRLIFTEDLSRYPLALADEHALQIAEAQCTALLHNAVSRGKLSDWVAMMMREASGGMPSLEELARTLNLSARTLDRYLQKEGRQFRELAAEQRQRRAEAMLADNQLSITQIALELGYSDAANFTRAFRKISGVSPSQWRAQISAPAHHAP